MKVLVIGWYGVGNTGDEAILFNITRSLHHHDPNIKLIIPSFDPFKTRFLLKNYTFLIESTPKLGSKTAFFKTNFKELLIAYKNTDIVLIGGGGMLQDAYNWYTIPYFSIFALLGKLFNKPVHFFNIGVGPTYLSFSKRILNRLCSISDSVYVRDKGSLAYLQGITFEKSNIKLGADPVFYQQKLPAVKSNNPYIAIAVRNVKQWKELDIKNFSQIIDTITENHNLDIVFVPFGAYTNRALGSLTEPQDYLVSQEIKNCMHYPERVSILKSEDVEDITETISGAQLLISMRLHGLIIATTQETPAIAIGYKQDDKLFRHQQQVGLEHLYLPISSMTANNFSRLLETINEAHQEIINQLKGKRKLLRKEYQQSIKDIFEVKENRQVPIKALITLVVIIIHGSTITCLKSLIYNSRTYYQKGHEKRAGS